MATLRDADGNMVGRAVPYADGDPATPLEGDAAAGPIYTADRDMVGRTALYQVSGGVAQPVSSLGVSPDTVGQPGGPAGPLDENGEIPLAQIPIDGINFKGAWDASANSPALTDGTGTAGDLYRVSVAGSQDLGSGAQDYAVGDHVVYEGSVWQRFDPPQAIAWGDITGTLANQADLQSALDAKAAIASLAAVATSGAYTDLSGQPITRQTGTVALILDGEELSWPTDIATGKVRLYNTTPGSANTFYGLGIANGALVYQVDSNTSEHRFQGVDGSDTALDIVRMSAQGGIVASVDLHMSEKKVVNVGNPDSARDAANKQYVDQAVSGAGQLTVAIHTDADAPSIAATDPQVQLYDLSAASTGQDINLPADAPTGTVFTIKKIDASSNALLMFAQGGQLLDGQDSASISAQHGFLTIVFDGTNWRIIGRGGA